jgi:hypothetical protein
MRLHPEVLVPSQQTLFSRSAEISRKWGAYLAGGAAAALQLGHRRSVDFDWFTQNTLPPSQILKDLESLQLPIDVRQNNEGTFLAQVGGVDFSVFRYRYGLVGTPIEFEGCQLASLEDIAAMKMTAIVQRAVKRDYVDLYVFFKVGNLSLSQVVTTMGEKFPGLDPSMALRAMTYFEDVEKQPMPVMLAKISWADVKSGLVRVRERGLGLSR